jgi:hypothetical protein
VSSSVNNQVQINLAFIQLHYQSKNLRINLTPAVGSYMNKNYSTEPSTFENIMEANVGVLLSEKRNVWLDAGIFNAHYTNESPISRDQLMYTRSMGPENSPYYLSGARLSMPLNNKMNAALFFLNGWQVIDDNNDGKALGTLFEYKVFPQLTFNWNTFLGDERSASNPNYRTRFFSDFYWVYKPNNKIDASSSFYVGWQKLNNGNTFNWWQVNIIGRYSFNEDWSLSGRLEYFSDPDLVLITPLTNVNLYQASSAGLCLNRNINKTALVRLELKQLFSNENIYLNNDNLAVKKNLMAVVNLTAWF